MTNIFAGSMTRIDYYCIFYYNELVIWKLVKIKLTQLYFHLNIYRTLFITLYQKQLFEKNYAP